MRHGEWIVFEVILPIFFLLIHREVCHPAKGDIILRHESESITASKSYLSENFADDLVFTRSEKYHISDFWREFRLKGCEFISGEELQNRRLRTIDFVDDIRKSSGSMRLRHLGE